MVTARRIWIGLACIALIIAGWKLLISGYGVLASESGTQLPPGIEKLELRSENNLILLDVFLEEPMECKDIIKVLDIDNLVVSERVFVPICELITHLHYRIRYKETLSA